MAEALVIVESPAKAKTINKFLGKGFQVEASMGHVRDLPSGNLGVDDEGSFAPSYVLLEDRKKVLDKLTKEAKKASRIFIATDPDREGEAIGWHLAEVLKEQGHDLPIFRVMFNEITKQAVTAALEHPTQIDKNRVDAQQARRILDRLMGYKLSPLLWDKVRRGLSAGRVQSVALRIVCEREDAIRAFVPDEYWVHSALLEGRTPPAFTATLKRRAGKDFKVRSQAESDAVLAALDGAQWTVATLETKERRRNPTPPFTTSRFQQEASRRFRIPVRRAMQIAQALYEGKEIGARGSIGLITYMRTDSTRVADEAALAAREQITKTLGAELLPEKPPVYKSKAGAQDAHEAIRPTTLDLPPEAAAEYLSPDELRVYTLIWQRFLASQMKPAVFDETIVEVDAAGHGFEARGSVLKFAGFMRVYQEAVEEDQTGTIDSAQQEGRFPQLAVGDVLTLQELLPEQKFTQPPPRFTEATLVKELEENGIGRPSTYAQILQTLGQREYTLIKETRFHPSELGMLVNGLVVGSFADLVDVTYTRTLEQELDEIEAGRRDWIDALRTFYVEFKKALEKAQVDMPNVKGGMPTDQICDKCGAAMVKKIGRFGFFLACSAYPACKNTKQEEEPGAVGLIEPCPNCEKTMALRRGRFGAFLACPDYPECKGTARVREEADGTFKVLRDKKLDENCPECKRHLIERDGRFGKFISCSGYPDCEYVKQEKTGTDCPTEGCGGDLVVKRSRKAKPFYGCSRYPKCDFVVWDLPVEGACPKCAAPFLTRKSTKKHGEFRCCWKEGCGWHDGPEGAYKPARARTPRRVPAGRPAAKIAKAAPKRAAKKAAPKRAAKAASKAAPKARAKQAGAAKEPATPGS